MPVAATTETPPYRLLTAIGPCFEAHKQGSRLFRKQLDKMKRNSIWFLAAFHAMASEPRTRRSRYVDATIKAVRLPAGESCAGCLESEAVPSVVYGERLPPIGLM